MKKQLIIVGIILVLIAVGLSGCTEEETEELSGGLFVNEECGFSFNEPDGWIVDESQSLNGGTISFYTSNYDTSICVTWIEGQDGVPFSETLTFDTISDLPDFVLISNNIMSINGLDAYEYIFDYSYIIDGEDIIEKSRVVEFEIGKDYIVFYYDVFKPDIYDVSISIFDDVLDSFELI